MATARVQQKDKAWVANYGKPGSVKPAAIEPSRMTRSTETAQRQVHPVGGCRSHNVPKQRHSETSSLEHGRSRSVSFDSVYFHNILPKESNAAASSASSSGHLAAASTNGRPRHGPGSQRSSTKSDHSSVGDGQGNRQRSSTLNLPDIGRSKGVVSTGRAHAPGGSLMHAQNHHYHHLSRHHHHHHHHPLLLRWRSSSDSHGSVASGSSDVSYLGRRHRIKAPKIPMANTYQLQPRHNFHSREGRIRDMVDDFLEGTLSNLAGARGIPASPEDAAGAAAALSEAIKEQLKLMNLPRYKIVCLATVAPRSGQDLVSGSRCLWDAETDGFVSVTRQNKQWFGEVTVYAVYME
ncbi:uncharacterized protein [Diadema setosum]|uniref:uncharacterized protein n=1 Tax=Diadema setosum TaxID=31175 RepID=UPI003B3B5B9E